ncbi:hypothetical protein JD292_05185 [Leucobacter sp. CSA2]|uniref:DUF4760 domain-containing protein n=1 Tax=Leucobacter edaphi TaxID=2796472 RepID=A0A934QCT6_9MICO|nr:hypothetical protein [Leucobacter edaphi]MBK0421465.1 hypothetical protein [Leucobacter edaphi]
MLNESLIATNIPLVCENCAAGIDWSTILLSLLASVIGGGIAIAAQHYESNRSLKRDYEHRLDTELAEYVRVVQRWVGMMQAKGPVDGTDLLSLDEIQAHAHSSWLISRGEDAEVLRELVHTLGRTRDVADPEQRVIDVRTTSTILRAWRNEGHDRAKAIERLIGVAARD